MREIQYRPAPALPGTGAPGDERSFCSPTFVGRVPSRIALRCGSSVRCPINGPWKPTRHPDAW